MQGYPQAGRWVPFRLPEPPVVRRPERRPEVRPSFQRTVSDETMRIELGAEVVAALAVENLDLSTPAHSEAVRRFIVEHRAG